MSELARESTATSTGDPREIMNRSDMSLLQVLIVGLTVFLNAMDGFDVQVIAVSANGIMTEWGLDRAALGYVLTAELFGMAIGSIVFGGLADRIGRRPVLLICLSLMAAGMFAATTATNPFALGVWRVLTGLGIGGTLSCTNAVAAEFSNQKRRGLCISLMVIGYPLGGMAVSLLAERILVEGSWRTLFHIGGGLAAALLPLVYFCVPESVHWLSRVQPENALQRINGVLARFGRFAVARLPILAAPERKHSILDIFSPSLLPITLITLAAYACHMLTFYFLVKWIPTIVTDFGFNPALASGVATWTNIGAAVGGLTFGLLSTRVGLKPLTIATLMLSVIGIVAFGNAPVDLAVLKAIAAGAGFATNAAISGIYSIVAVAFPTHVRATGTGFVIGVGRGGAVMSPIVSGYLFQWELALSTIALVMAGGSFVAAAALGMLRLNAQQNRPDP